MARLALNPTRIELRKCKTRLKSARSGHKLLKDKSDEMVRQFLIYAGRAKQNRAEVERQLSAAIKKFALARAVSSADIIENALADSTVNASVKISIKSIMGVDVPVIKPVTTTETPVLPYRLYDAPPELDNAVLGFYAVLERLLMLAEIEKTCALLAEEIEKTRRRVNALEYIMIPDLQETIAYIQMRLDENERGAIVRLMKVKDKLENKND